MILYGFLRRLLFLSKHDSPPLIHAAATFIAAELAPMHMIVSIIPASITISVVRWAVGAVTIAAAIMPLLIGATGHINTSNYAKQGSEET